MLQGATGSLAMEFFCKEKEKEDTSYQRQRGQKLISSQTSSKEQDRHTQM